MALGGEHKDVSLPRRAEARKSELMTGVAEVALGEREDPGIVTGSFIKNSF